MNSESHKILTRCVCEHLLLSETEINVAVEYSSFPDYADDVIFNIFSHKFNSLFNHNGSSLTHFCRPTRNMKFMGYLFNKDGSITKMKKPKIVSIEVDSENWIKHNILKRSCKLQHPIKKLLDVDGYTNDLFKFTFPTSAVMAEFISKYHNDKIKAASCCAHLACDICIRDHTTGTLFDGHQTYEGKINEIMKKEGNEIIEKTLKNETNENKIEPRKLIEMQAEKIGAFSNRPKVDFVIKEAAKIAKKIFLFFLK